MNDDKYNKDHLDALQDKAQEFAAEGVKARLYWAQTNAAKPSSYKGKIVAIDGDSAVQELNAKGSYIAHLADGLSVGDVVNIGYNRGQRTVEPYVAEARAERPARAPRAPQADALESNAPKDSKVRPEGKPVAEEGKKKPSSRKTTEPKKSMADIDNDKYRKAAERIVKAIDEGTSIWQKPWVSAAKKSRPHNNLTGANYQGMNRVLLMTDMLSRGSGDTRYMTYKQTATLAAEMAKNGTPEDKLPGVRKGAESIELFKFGRAVRKVNVLDDAGNPKKTPDGKDVMKEKFGRSFLQSFHVFHASDIENMPALELAEKKADWEVHAEAERLLELSGVPIRHEATNRAYFEPLANRITVPEMVQFKDASSYYSVVLHEVAHSSGHASKLNREGIAAFAGFVSPSYSYEELVAESASAFIASDLGLDNDAVMANHASYLTAWSSKIKDDPKALFKAFAEAEQAADWVLQRHPIQLEAKAALHQANELALQQGMTVGTATADVDYTEGLFDQQPKTAQQGAGLSM